MLFDGLFALSEAWKGDSSSLTGERRCDFIRQRIVGFLGAEEEVFAHLVCVLRMRRAWQDVGRKDRRWDGVFDHAFGADFGCIAAPSALEAFV